MQAVRKAESLTATDTIPSTQSLCPALGFRGGSIGMKVAKCAEYIPIVGSFVGVGHLVYALYKRVKRCEGAGSHALRALVAITSCGAILAVFDIGTEIFRAKRSAIVRVDRIDAKSAEVIVTSEEALMKFMMRLYDQKPSCCTGMAVLEKGRKYRLVYQSGPDRNMRAFFHRLHIAV